MNALTDFLWRDIERRPLLYIGGITGVLWLLVALVACGVWSVVR